MELGGLRHSGESLKNSLPAPHGTHFEHDIEIFVRIFYFRVNEKFNLLFSLIFSMRFVPLSFVFHFPIYAEDDNLFVCSFYDSETTRRRLRGLRTSFC